MSDEAPGAARRATRSTRAPPAWDRVRVADLRILRFLRQHSPTILRITLALVFVWFGMLKILDLTPVEDLVRATLWYAPLPWIVPALGVVEVLLGLGLLFRVAMRLVLLVVFLQLLGTFSVFVFLPQVAFVGGNPLLLTVEGEFVAKNLVLLAAALVVGGTLRPLPEEPPVAAPAGRR